MDLFEVNENEIKKLPLRKVIIENYRNIKFKEILFDEKGIILSGKNGLGKTNIIEAIYWVLSGALFDGRSQAHMIKVTPENSEKGIKTSVKLEWAVKPFTIEKIFYENWRDEECRGGETAYYINGAFEKKNKQAESMIREFLGLESLMDKFSKTQLKDIDLTALIFNIDYLKTLDYKLLRGFITDIVGDIDYKPIISKNVEKYGKLVDPLKAHNLDLERLKEATRNNKFGTRDRKGLLDLISGTEMTISELQQEIDKISENEDVEKAKARIKEVETLLQELNIKLKQGETEIVKDIDLQIANLRNEISETKEKIRLEHEEKLSKNNNKELDDKIKSLENLLTEKREQRISLSELITNKENEISTLNTKLLNLSSEEKNVTQRLEQLRNDYKNAKNPNQNETLTCPHCQQPFEIHNTKEHQKIIYEKIEKINQDGQKTKNRLDEITEGKNTTNRDIKECEKTLIKFQQDRTQFDTTINEIETELKELRQARQETTVERHEIDFNVEPLPTLMSSVQRLTVERDSVLIDFKIEQRKTQTKIEELLNEKETLAQQANVDVIKISYENKLKQKTEDLKTLNKDLIKTEDLLTLIKEVEREMFETLDKKLVNVFGENITFQLYKINVDGSIDTRICDMLVRDKWNNFINIKNVNTGMYPIRATEFINKVKEHYGILKSFIFVDEIGNLDDEHRELLGTFDEQIIATQGNNELKISERKF